MRKMNWVMSAMVLMGMAAVARGEVKVTVDYNSVATASAAFRFKTVPAPVKNDAGAGAVMTLVAGESDGNGADLAALTDGLVPKEEDEPAANFFFDAGTLGGRFRMDLGSVIGIDQVNTYSWHPNTRGPQVYKLYASDGTGTGFNAAPKEGVDPAGCGWKLIATVDTRPPQGDGGGQYGVSIADSSGPLGKFRYLWFVCIATEADDDWGNTFYSEVDVVANK